MKKLKKLKKLLSRTITTKADAVIYIGKLHKLGCQYHLDDDATEIECFGPELGKLANQRANECFDLLCNDAYCPLTVSLACLMD